MTNGTAILPLPSTPNNGKGTKSTNHNSKGSVNTFGLLVQKIAGSTGTGASITGGIQTKNHSKIPVEGHLGDSGLKIAASESTITSFTDLAALLGKLQKMLKKSDNETPAAKNILKELTMLQNLVKQAGKILGKDLSKSDPKGELALKGAKKHEDASTIIQNVQHLEAFLVPLMHMITLKQEALGQTLPQPGQQLVTNPKQLTPVHSDELSKILAKTIIELQQFTTSAKTSASDTSKLLKINAKPSSDHKTSSAQDVKSSSMGSIKAKTETSNSSNDKSNQQSGTAFQSGAMNRIQQLSFHQPKPSVPVNQQLIQKITDYLGKGGIQTLKNGSQQMTITLHPASLGQVTITLTQDSTGILAKISTAQAGTKELIQSQLQQLNQGLQAQQIPVHKIEVSQTVWTNQPQQQTFNQQQQDSGQQQQGSLYESSEETNDEQGQTFEEWLRGGAGNEY